MQTIKRVKHGVDSFRFTFPIVVLISLLIVLLLTKQQDHLIINKTENNLKINDKICCPDMQQYLVLPVILDRQFTAVIILATKQVHPYPDANILQARQLADQVGVALTNSRLLEEMNMISWGTLTALARTVDAKSPWTAGHSEKVAKLALKIGMQSDLNAKTLMHLRRAAFLHDIGKIGIRSAILDKPEKLDAAEFDIIKKHPDAGARILKPINVFAPLIPMIRQHHERFDGSGYPDGVAGDQIDIGVRILAKLYGRWVTNDDKYADRFFELSQYDVSFGVGDDRTAEYSIVTIRGAIEDNNTIYTITFEDDEGTEYSQSVHFSQSDHDLLLFKNQNGIEWYKQTD